MGSEMCIRDSQSTGAAWLQFNWASFGGGISTVIIICVLLVALWVALKYNRKANKKARRAELHELLLLSSRHHRIYDQPASKEPSQPVRTSSGYPGMSSYCHTNILSRTWLRGIPRLSRLGATTTATVTTASTPAAPPTIAGISLLQSPLRSLRSFFHNPSSAICRLVPHQGNPRHPV